MLREERALLIFPDRNKFMQSDRMEPNTLALPMSATADENDEPQPRSESIVLELLDARRRRQSDHPSRSEAIERLVATGLAPETRKWILEPTHTALDRPDDIMMLKSEFRPTKEGERARAERQK